MNELKNCTKNRSQSTGGHPPVFYSILDVKEHPVKVLPVRTLQYVNHSANMLPLNWKSITKFFAECFTFKKLCD
jgi:hypothetical protein